MSLRELITEWFNAWDKGNYQNIPVSDDFRHTSPYGTIEGKEAYLKIVEENKDKFLGNKIEIKDEIYSDECACVRYTITNKDFTMEVSEWYYPGDDTIKEIIAYYNIEGEISESRKVSGLK